MTTEQLLQLKEEIQTAKERISQLEGKRQLLMEQLANTFRCKTITAAQSKLVTLREQAEALKDKIVDKINALEDKL